MTTDTIPTIEREIKYSRQDRDYACYVNGQYIGSRANYSDAETLCDQVAYDLLMDGQCATATELDGGSEPDAMAADHAVVAPACATCGGEGRCPDCDPITPARHWSHDLPAYGADNCAGCGGPVPCRCDDEGRLYCPNNPPTHHAPADRVLSICPGAFDVCGTAAQLAASVTETAACTSTNPCGNPNHNHSTIYTALLTEADAAPHPSYAPFCQRCALALQRVAVATYVQRLADDLGLACSFCGEAHDASDCPLRRPLIVPGPRVCGCCGGAHHIQQCGELRAALFAKAEVFY